MDRQRGWTYGLVACGLWGALFLSFAVAQTREEPSPETRKVLALMDRANQTLIDLSADLKQTKVIVAVDDISLDTGKLYFKKEKNGNKTKFVYLEPDPKTILIDKGKVQIYEPRINRLYSPDLGKNKAESEFFMVGFGSSASLTRVYSARYVKDEPINNQKTSVLELIPKSTGAMFTKVILWVDQVKGLPIQIRLYETTGDYLTVLFENMAINPKLHDNIFKIKK